MIPYIAVPADFAVLTLAAFEFTVNVTVELPLAGTLTVQALREHPMTVFEVEQETPTGPLNPFTEVTVTGKLVDPPFAMVALRGDTEDNGRGQILAEDEGHAPGSVRVCSDLRPSVFSLVFGHLLETADVTVTLRRLRGEHGRT